VTKTISRLLSDGRGFVFHSAGLSLEDSCWPEFGYQYHLSCMAKH
jgi:hypothetical protein